MKTFRINKELTIVCEWKNTRNGFKHEASLIKNGWHTVDSTKVCYLNRTWESFEYETVIKKLLERSNIPKGTQTRFLNKISGRVREQVKQQFKTVSMVAQIGELLCNTPKEKNDWKLRMIQAGLENQGLQVPEDWDQLSEDEKTNRLDKVINELKK